MDALLSSAGVRSAELGSSGRVDEREATRLSAMQPSDGRAGGARLVDEVRAPRRFRMGVLQLRAQVLARRRRQREEAALEAAETVRALNLQRVQLRDDARVLPMPYTRSRVRAQHTQKTHMNMHAHTYIHFVVLARASCRRPQRLQERRAAHAALTGRGAAVLEEMALGRAPPVPFLLHNTPERPRAAEGPSVGSGELPAAGELLASVRASLPQLESRLERLRAARRADIAELVETPGATHRMAHALLQQVRQRRGAWTVGRRTDRRHWSARSSQHRASAVVCGEQLVLDPFLARIDASAPVRKLSPHHSSLSAGAPDEEALRHQEAILVAERHALARSARPHARLSVIDMIGGAVRVHGGQARQRLHRWRTAWWRRW